MKAMVMDHQGKSRLIAEALSANGCMLVSDPLVADVILIDHDVPSHGKIQHAVACVAAGGRAFVYPHGAGAAQLAGWDGIMPISPALSGVLATGPGHAEVARRFGYPHPVHDIGWTFCELRPRRATGRVEHVVFAPIHPLGDGNLIDWKQEHNRRIFERLRTTRARLTVRHIGSLESNGLREADGVEYVRSELDSDAGQLAQIDAADVVVSDRGTFSNLAIARGVTTLMFDSTLIAEELDETATTDHIDLYRDYIRFPFDPEEGLDIWELMQAAAADEELVGDWRARFIGDPLDGERLVEILRGDGVHLDPVSRSVRLHEAALQAVSAGDHWQGERLLAEAIGRVVNLELLNDLAVVRFGLGRRDDAEALLRACLALNPGYGAAAENLAAIAPAVR